MTRRVRSVPAVVGGGRQEQLTEIREVVHEEPIQKKLRTRNMHRASVFFLAQLSERT